MRHIVPIALVVLLFCGIAYAQVPREIHFQGYLTDVGANPLTGTYSIVFRIYDVSTGGSALWTETHATVDVANGYYDVTLGSVTALSLAFDAQYFLSIEVEADGEMDPRFAMCSAPYAIRAEVADDAEALNGEAPSYYLDYNNFANTPSSLPPDAHTHPGADITSAVASADNADTVDSYHASTTPAAGRLLALDGGGMFPSSVIPSGGFADDADLLDGEDGLYYLAWANITGAPAIFPSDWSIISNIPGTFPPSAHTHPWGDVTGKPATYPSDWATLANKPAKYPDADLLDGLDSSAFAAAGHNHNHGALTGLGNDDHTQYLLANGGRAVSGALVPSATNLRDLGSSGLNWQDLYVCNSIRSTYLDFNLYLYANGGFYFHMDEDNDTGNFFNVLNGINTTIFSLNESGNLFLTGGISCASLTTTGTISAGANVNPDASLTNDLGTPSLHWDDLYVDAIRAQSSTTDNLELRANADVDVYLDSDNNGGNESFDVYDGTGSAVLRVYEDGNAQARGDFVYMAPKTYYLGVHPVAFRKGWPSSTAEWLTDYSWGGYINTGATSCSVYAPVYLPQGAIVTRIDFYYYDNNAGDLDGDAYLYRRGYTVAGGTIMANASLDTTGVQTGTMQTASDTGIVSATIDNNGYQYFVRCRWNPGVTANTMRWYGAKITYTMTTVAP